MKLSILYQPRDDWISEAPVHSCPRTVAYLFNPPKRPPISPVSLSTSESWETKPSPSPCPSVSRAPNWWLLFVHGNDCLCDFDFCFSCVLGHRSVHLLGTFVCLTGTHPLSHLASTRCHSNIYSLALRELGYEARRESPLVLVPDGSASRPLHEAEMLACDPALHSSKANCAPEACRLQGWVSPAGY